MPAAAIAADLLAIDEHTWRDLEVFEARKGAHSVHDLLSLTRTTGGARVLKDRMQRPWSSPARIQAVQESLRYVIAHRRAFDCVPSDITVQGVYDYLNGGLPLYTSTNPLGALLDALSLRWSEFRYYAGITQGVMRTIKMIRGLRRILEPASFPTPVPGELGPLLDEMRGLLERRAFEGLPEMESWGLPILTLLSLDRGFRGDEEKALRRLLRLVYQVDALVAMADATVAYGMVIPEVLDGPATVAAEGLVNLFLSGPVPVAVQLGRERHMLFLTGPNMAGKTTFLRSLGVALYLAHLGMGVPATCFRFAPSQSLFTALNMSDDIHGGVSFFRAEAIRIMAIAEAMNSGRRVFALVDEPFKGTNVKDAMDASWMVLEEFAAAADCLFAVSSHLIELGDRLQSTERVLCCRFEAAEREDGLHFDFTLRGGISSQRLGMQVLEQEGLMKLLRDRSGRRAWE